MRDMRAAVVAIAALLLIPAALAAASPHVRLVGRAPLAVSGSGFRHHERVLVTVSNGTVKLSTRVRTTARGTFTARFARDLPQQACGQIAIAARGATGDRAGWKTPPQVCGAQLAP